MIFLERELDMFPYCVLLDDTQSVPYFQVPSKVLLGLPQERPFKGPVRSSERESKASTDRKLT